MEQGLRRLHRLVRRHLLLLEPYHQRDQVLFQTRHRLLQNLMQPLEDLLQNGEVTLRPRNRSNLRRHVGVSSHTRHRFLVHLAHHRPDPAPTLPQSQHIGQRLVDQFLRLRRCDPLAARSVQTMPGCDPLHPLLSGGNQSRNLLCGFTRDHPGCWIPNRLCICSVIQHSGTRFPSLGKRIQPHLGQHENIVVDVLQRLVHGTVPHRLCEETLIVGTQAHTGRSVKLDSPQGRCTLHHLHSEQFILPHPHIVTVRASRPRGRPCCVCAGKMHRIKLGQRTLTGSGVNERLLQRRAWTHDGPIHVIPRLSWSLGGKPPAKHHDSGAHILYRSTGIGPEPGFGHTARRHRPGLVRVL